MNKNIVRINKDVIPARGGYKVKVWATMPILGLPFLWKTVSRRESWGFSQGDAYYRGLSLRDEICEELGC